MFYPNATFPAGTVVQFEDHAFGNPTSALTFNPTIEIILWQPYFLAMKAIAYMIFVVTIGRLFEFSENRSLFFCVQAPPAPCQKPVD